MANEDEPDLPRRLERLAADLERLIERPEALASVDPGLRRRVLEAAGRLSHPNKQELRKRAKAFRRQDREQTRAQDLQTLEHATLRKEKLLSSFLPQQVHGLLGIAVPESEPAPDTERAELLEPRACYVCKADYTKLHFFYHALCPSCAAFNYGKRDQTADLTGRVALVTGSRIKIGYFVVLKLLRAGAQVIATTRFPVDSASRFVKEPDYEAFADRLTIHGLDLRHTPSVERFAQHLRQTLPRLDILINNAAQTVRRPPEFYRHMLQAERAQLASLPEPVVRLLASANAAAPASDLLARSEQPQSFEASMVHWSGEAAQPAGLFPEATFDGEGQQIDLRSENSWRLDLADVPTPELLEVHLVNAIAPFVLTKHLKPLMMQDRTDEKHVIHVSAMEASFSRKKKTVRHPHTNMAKAALNMMTRTSAADYQADGIFMNSVDTGWITDEDPLHHAVRKETDYAFSPPLDSIDGAARVLDPLFLGLNSKQHPWGIFFKDYRSVDW